MERPCKKAWYIHMRKQSFSSFHPPHCDVVLGVVRSKVVTPLGDAVCFVNHKAFQQVAAVKVPQHGMKPRRHGHALWCDV